MSTNVTIMAKAWGDFRFDVLAKLCGLADHGHALIRCARIWAWQAEHFTPEKPTYVVSAELIQFALGKDEAPQFMVRAQLAEETREGFRIRGSVGSIEWKWNARVAGLKGTRAAQRKRADKADPTGCAVGSGVGHALGHPPGYAIDTQTHTLPIPIPTPPVQISDSLPHARTIPGDVVPSTEARKRGALAEKSWKRLSEVRILIASELEIRDVLPLPAITPGSHPAGFRELQSRIREEGENAAKVCDRVLEVLTAQARELKSIEWLSEKAFTEGGWRTAREAIPGFRATPNKRAQPVIGSAAPRTDHPDSPTLTPIRDL